MSGAPLNAHTILTDWNTGVFALFVGAVLVVLAVTYVAGTRTLAARHGRRWHPSRTVSFVAGLVAIELALGSSVPTLAMNHFSAHIIQHLLLMVIAPPLLALGAPMTLILQTSSRSTKRVLTKALHSNPFALLTHPVVVFFLYFVSMFAFFLSPALGYAMQHMWLMDLINLGFLGGSTLYWWPMVGLDPIPRWRMTPGVKLINLLVGIAPETILGLALLLQGSNSNATMYSVGSIHVGGGLLWAATELATFVAVIPVFVQWVRSEERAGRRINARIEEGEAITVAPLEGHGLASAFKMMKRT